MSTVPAGCLSLTPLRPLIDSQSSAGRLGLSSPLVLCRLCPDSRTSPVVAAVPAGGSLPPRAVGGVAGPAGPPRAGAGPHHSGTGLGSADAADRSCRPSAKPGGRGGDPARQDAQGPQQVRAARPEMEGRAGSALNRRGCFKADPEALLQTPPDLPSDRFCCSRCRPCSPTHPPRLVSRAMGAQIERARPGVRGLTSPMQTSSLGFSRSAYKDGTEMWTPFWI